MRSDLIPVPGEPLRLGEFLAIDSRFPAVYFLVHRGEVVYVGQSKTLRWRIDQHITEAVKLFDAVAYVRCSVDQLTSIEGHYIRQYVPRYNHCAIALKARQRAAWTQGRPSQIHGAAADALPIQIGDISDIVYKPHEIGEFLMVSDRDAAAWYNAGEIADLTMAGLWQFMMANTRKVTKAQERFEALWEGRALPEEPAGSRRGAQRAAPSKARVRTRRPDRPATPYP